MDDLRFMIPVGVITVGQKSIIRIYGYRFKLKT